MTSMRTASGLLLKTLLGLSLMAGVQNITAQVKAVAPVTVEVFNATAVLSQGDREPRRRSALLRSAPE